MRLFEAKKISYFRRIIHRARKMQLATTPDGIVEVIVPRDYSQRVVPRFLDGQQPWINQSLMDIPQHKQATPPLYRVPPNLISLKAIAKHWHVVYKKALNPFHFEWPDLFDKNRLIVCGAQIDQRLMQLKRWLLNKSIEYLTALIGELSDQPGLCFRVSM